MNHNKPTDYAQAVSDYFFKFLKNQKGLSDNTVASYKDTMSLLCRYFEIKHGIRREHMEISHLSRESIEGFYECLETEKNYAPASRNQRRAALNTFFRYLQYKDPGYVLLCQNILAIPKKKYSRQNIRHLSLEAVTEILKQPDTQTRDGQRDFALISIMYESAARISEIVMLDIGNVDLNQRGGVLHLKGKGSKKRSVPLVNEISDSMRKYLESEGKYRDVSTENPFFCNRKNERFTRAGATYVFQKYVKLAKQKNPALFPEKISPHILRHSRAMHWLEMGLDLEYIQRLLGHEQASTTGIYARISTELAARELEKVRPPRLIDEAKGSWDEDQDLMSWLAGFQ